MDPGAFGRFPDQRPPPPHRNHHMNVDDRMPFMPRVPPPFFDGPRGPPPFPPMHGGFHGMEPPMMHNPMMDSPHRHFPRGMPSRPRPPRYAQSSAEAVLQNLVNAQMQLEQQRRMKVALPQQPNDVFFNAPHDSAPPAGGGPWMEGRDMPFNPPFRYVEDPASSPFRPKGRSSRAPPPGAMKLYGATMVSSNGGSAVAAVSPALAKESTKPVGNQESGPIGEHSARVPVAAKRKSKKQRRKQKKAQTRPEPGEGKLSVLLLDVILAAQKPARSTRCICPSG